MKQEFPRSARDALARQAAADDHPSADLLNGFVEHALGADERAWVTAHLAICGDCRDVVFLTNAAIPDEQRAASANRKGAGAGWSRWGMWKWLAPAMAALVIVGGIVVERHQSLTAHTPANATVTMNARTVNPRMQARDAAPDELNSAAGKNSSAVSAEQPKKTEAASHAAQHVKALMPPEAGAAPKEQTELAQAAPRVGLPRGAWPIPDAQPKTASPVQSSAGPRQVGSNAATAARTQTNIVASQPPSTVAEVANQPATLSSRLEANTRNASGLGASGLSLATRATIVASHWRISAEGHLERSTQPGQWTRSLAEQPVSFRTVAVVGNEVWAGGSGGALFHSSDAGDHWMQIALVADGQSEHGAVQSIRFDSPLAGRVTTDAGTTWSTEDGGKTWSRQ